MQRSRLLRTALVLLAAVTPLVADAHPGPGVHESFAQGMAHPLSGLDHLLAILGTGMWAGQQTGRLRWLLPLSFFAMMIAGAAIGFGTPPPGALDQALAATVLLCGLFVASSLQARSTTALLASGGFALLHGIAHGVEGPGVGPVGYALGYLATTLALGAAGFLAATLAQRYRAEGALRLAGGVVAAAGLTLSLV